VSALADFLARNARIPDLIVVAIPNTRDRTHDLSPAGDTTATFAVSGRDTIAQRFPTAGGAAKMRAFLTEELAPWVEARYRTAPYRILVGHSLGGLFTVDALTYAPKSFNAYVAISPSLWWDHGRYVKRVEADLARTSLDGRALYMTTGAREPQDVMIDPARALAAWLDARHLAGFHSWYHVMPTETHNSNPLRTEYDALEQIFSGWEPPDSVTEAAQIRGDIGPLVAHRAMLAKRFGFPISLTPDEVNQLAYGQLQQKKIDGALRLFRYNTEHTPDYANGWDSLADGLEASGDAAGAIRSEEKAVQLGEAQHDPALGDYRAHLDRLQKATAKHQAP
jgi:predicted alpha/beta superfamily hydrolase